VKLSGVPAALLDGPVELEAPVDLDALDGFPPPLVEEDGDRGGLFRPRRSLTRAEDEPGVGTAEPHRRLPDPSADPERIAPGDPAAPLSLPSRRTPKLVSSHGRPVSDQRPRRSEAAEDALPRPEAPRPDDTPAPLPSRRRGATAHIPRSVGAGAYTGHGAEEPYQPPALPRRTRQTAALQSGPEGPEGPAERPGAASHRSADAAPRSPEDSARQPGAAAHGVGSGTGPLPRRVRQANLAPQLRQGPTPREDRTDPTDRDADEVRSRMASLQRGWQRGRAENAAGEDAHSGTAPQGTTKGDGR
jgi:hypothetical protein